MLVPSDIQSRIESAPPEAQAYLRAHKPLKIRLTLFFCQRLRSAFNGKFNADSDFVSLGSCVIFNNTDEIIDDGFLETPEEKRAVVTHLQNLIKGVSSSGFECDNVDPLKIRELEYLAREVRSLVRQSLGSDVYLDTMDQLAEVVKLQIDKRFEDVADPNSLMFAEACAEVDSLIEAEGFDIEIQSRLKLATRMGAYTGAVMVPVSDIDPSDKGLKALYFFGAAFQLIDDLLDLNDDLNKGQETFATALSREGEQSALVEVRKLARALFSLAYQNTDSTLKAIKLRFFSKIFTLFTIANSTRNLRSVLNPTDRLGVNHYRSGGISK